MLKTKAVFESNFLSFCSEECIIESIVLMNSSEFEDFKNNLQKNRTFIKDRKEDMFVDEKGVTHGLLVLNNDSGDGILIDSNGHDFSRYAAYLPNINYYIDKQLSQIADKLMDEGLKNTSNGSWTMFFDEIKESYGLTVKENNGIDSMLYDILKTREEMAEIEIEDECFTVTFYLDYCKNLNEKEVEDAYEEDKPKDFVCIAFAVKEGSVDNIIVSDESEAVSHAKKLEEDYNREDVSEIAVYKHYFKDHINERIY